jgi:hypothetical protein
VLALIAVGVVIAIMSSDGGPSVPASAIRVPEPSSIGASVAADDRSVWIADYVGWLTRIDPRTRVPRTRVQLPSVYDMTLGGDALWVVGDRRSQSDLYEAWSTESPTRRIDPVLYLLDSTTGATKKSFNLTPSVQPTKLPPSPALVVDSGTVWVTTGAELVRLNAKSGTIASRTPMESSGVATTPGYVWTTQGATINDKDPSENTFDVLKIDPATGTALSRMRIQGSGSSIQGTDTGLWVCSDRTIKLAPDGESILTTLDLPCTSTAQQDDRLWVAFRGGPALQGYGTGYVKTVDLQTLKQDAYPASNNPEFIDANSSGAWTLDYWGDWVVPVVLAGQGPATTGSPRN